MPTLTSTQLKRLKLDAKNQARELGIPLHIAQDNRAHELGFSNWALMMKHAAPDENSGPPLFKFIRSAEAMRDAMRNLPESFERAQGRNTRPNVDLADIWSEFSTAKHAVDFAIDYMATLLQVPRFKVGMRSLAYWELRSWLPYVLEPAGEGTQILANRYYKPVGMDVTEHVDYKKFGTLHSKLQAAQIAAFSHSLEGEGYLYGESPWSSRKAAEAYLKRLKILKSVLK